LENAQKALSTPACPIPLRNTNNKHEKKKKKEELSSIL
jgi:hypothetical protein